MTKTKKLKTRSLNLFGHPEKNLHSLNERNSYNLTSNFNSKFVWLYACMICAFV